MSEIKFVECKLISGAIVNGFIGTHKEYNFGDEPQVLGNGAFGLVQKCTRQSSDESGNLNEEALACKILRSDGLDEYTLQTFTNELGIIKSLNHKNIVKYIDSFNVNIAGFPEIGLIVFELLGATLRDYLETKPYYEYENRFMVHQLLEAVEYLHSRDIIHTDIKAENCLLTENSTRATLKLCDFGLADKVNLGIIKKYSSGTFRFLSPEMRFYKIHTKSCDIWCVGFLIYNMFTHEYPFFNNYKSRKEKAESTVLFEKGFYMKLKGVSKECSDLVEKMLQSDMNKRINVRKALDHDWFKKHVKELKPPSKQVIRLFKNDKYLKKRIQENYSDYKGAEIRPLNESSNLNEKSLENNNELSSDNSNSNIAFYRGLKRHYQIIDSEISDEHKKPK